jgi:hypothetical protein
VNVSRSLNLSGGRRLTLTLDCFNVFNVNTIVSYGSDNLDSASYTAVSQIVPPRVFRVGARIAF